MRIKTKYYIVMLSGLLLIPFIFLTVNYIVYYSYYFLSNMLDFFDYNIKISSNFIMYNVYIIFFLILFIVVILGSKFINQMLKKINGIDKKIEEITNNDALPELIQVKTEAHDEIDNLSLSINALIDRLRYKEISLDEEISKNKNFLNQIRHDINTPLTSLKLELFQLSKDENLTKSELSSLYDKIDYISHLSKEINLDYLKNIENFNTINNNININELLLTSLKKWSFLFKKSSIEVNIVQSNTPTIWAGDRTWFDRLFDNILSNIYHHSRTSCVVITMDSKIIIQDFGTGFDVDGQMRGTGLKIIKDISRRFSLNLAVSSNQNGTCFSISQHTHN